jgi:hypothetical protein
MTLQIEPRGRVSEEQVAAVERTLNVRLPASYRAWILRTGGGVPVEDLTIPGTQENGLITDFDGVDRLELLQELGDPKIVPDNYLIVALGSGGDLALRVAGGDEGSVWWADYDRADDLGTEAPSEQIMARLADDFDGFLALFP